MSVYRVLVADDHFLIREGIRRIVETIKDCKVSKEACNGRELIEYLKSDSAELVILDLEMPEISGFDALKAINKTTNETKVLVLSASEDPSDITRAFSLGVKGFINKKSTLEELSAAIEAVRLGGLYLSPSIDLSQISGNNPENKQTPFESLSERELEVALLLASGVRNQQIAKKLGLSTRTIDSHRTNILKKLDIKSNAELAKLAIKYNLS